MMSFNESKMLKKMGEDNIKNAHLLWKAQNCIDTQCQTEEITLKNSDDEFVREDNIEDEHPFTNMEAIDE